jgi:hypothetical protein
MTGMRKGNEAADWRRHTHLEDFEVRAAQRTEDGGEHGGEVSRLTWNCYRGHMRVGFNMGAVEKFGCDLLLARQRTQQKGSAPR